jgi:hypothetical protein
VAAQGYSTLPVTAGYVTVTAVAILRYWHVGVPSATEDATA